MFVLPSVLRHATNTHIHTGPTCKRKQYKGLYKIIFQNNEIVIICEGPLPMIQCKFS